MNAHAHAIIFALIPFFCSPRSFVSVRVARAGRGMRGERAKESVSLCVCVIMIYVYIYI